MSVNELSDITVIVGEITEITGIVWSAYGIVLPLLQLMTLEKYKSQTQQIHLNCQFKYSHASLTLTASVVIGYGVLTQ